MANKDGAEGQRNPAKLIVSRNYIRIIVIPAGMTGSIAMDGNLQALR
jgi:hypothetical protein